MDAYQQFFLFAKAVLTCLFPGCVACPPRRERFADFWFSKRSTCNSRSVSLLAGSCCIGNPSKGFSEDDIGYCHTHSASLNHILFVIFFGGMTFIWNMRQPCLFIHDSNIIQIFCISSGVFLSRFSTDWVTAALWLPGLCGYCWNFFIWLPVRAMIHSVQHFTRVAIASFKLWTHCRRDMERVQEITGTGVLQS